MNSSLIEIKINKLISNIPKNSKNNYKWHFHPKIVALLIKLWFDSNLKLNKFVTYLNINTNINLYTKFRYFTLGCNEKNKWFELQNELIKVFEVNNFDDYLILRNNKIRPQTES